MTTPELAQAHTEVLAAARVAEARIDAELAALDALVPDDLELLRQRRLRQRQLEHEQQQRWLQQGHGKYTALQNERDWFDAVKASRNVVVHFTRASTWRCTIVDKHLAKLAPKHLEARFVALDGEKAPFVCERLKVWMLPTLLIVRDGVVRNRLEGFGALGDTDDFSTRTLEAVLAQLGAFAHDALPAGDTDD